MYGAAGVKECWLVDPAGHIERWSGDGLVESETATHAMTSPLFPGLELELAELFRR